jgi:hypothetical protein
MNVRDVFQAAGLEPCGPASWGEPVPERGPGVYVVVADDQIIYIGRSGRPLRRRLREFYRHRHGARSPHRGGQAVLLLKCPLVVYWAATADYAAAENCMIEFFKSQVGELPYANRVRSARINPTLGRAFRK